MKVTVKSKDGDELAIKGSRSVLNELSGHLYSAWGYYKEKGTDNLAGDALLIADAIYDALDERGYYDSIREEKHEQRENEE